MRWMTYFIFIGIFLTFSYVCFGENKKEDKLKVVVFFLNNISFKELEHANVPTINYLLRNGALGLMNTRCAKGTNLPSLYLTLGASSRATAGEDALLAFNAEESFNNVKVVEIYQRRTGKIPQKDNIIHLGFEKLKKQNSKLGYTVFSGALGKLIRDNNLSSAVLGNSDTDRLHREVVCFIADEHGIVARGDVGKNILIKDVNSPYGIRCDTEKMFNKFLKFKKLSDVIVIDFGDMYRLTSENEFISKDRKEEQKRNILKNADGLIGNILKNINNDVSFLFISFPSTDKIYDEPATTLSPVIILNRNWGEGIITSSTTRQEGIITNLDIAPYILDFLNISVPDFMYGRNISFLPLSNAKEKIIHLEKRLSYCESQNISILEFLIFSYIIGVIISFLMILSKNKVLSSISQYILIFISSLPLSLLLQSLFLSETLLYSIFTVVILSIVITVALKVIIRNNLLALVSVAGITTCAVVVDTFLGSQLMKFSALGFSLSAGARFYGIGNEYTSVAVFSFIIFAGLLMDILQKYKNILKVILLVFCGIILYVIMSPQKGANVGGGATAIFAFSSFYFLISRKKIGLKKILGIFLLAFFILGMFILQDVAKKEKQSHLGKMIQQVKTEGGKVILDTVERKVSMNIKLIQYTRWNKILIVCLLIIVLLIYYPVKVLDKIKSEYMGVSASVSANLVGAISGLIFNDSGIIIAIIGITTITISLLYIISVQKIISEFSCNL